ncbi:hypothetical protein FisN_19Lu101 [Fistulifera solaris]|uniref:Uncharacterized protein n=1 Tax=Fistulifera solaris TaxID=1519565 RepID=A0A1Z5J6K2_FISSO|nr:hypothetical protein FisN_19Lu101 [Fistulifera solaris]|eukprot:GAX09635.1 hypothetical protein FisN_19Lu101 [Fistulifera solaris]
MHSATAFLFSPQVILTGTSSAFALPSTSPLLIASERIENVAAQTTFEPVIPDGSVMMGMISIVLLSGLAFYVWQEQVVPVSRTKLALSKRRGAVKQYLDELSAEEAIVRSEGRSSSSRSFERWLFTDWLVQREKKLTGQSIKKEPALPILKDAKWNSGDNPVIAATGLIGLCVLIASLTERIFQ